MTPRYEVIPGTGAFVDHDAKAVYPFGDDKVAQAGVEAVHIGGFNPFMASDVTTYSDVMAARNAQASTD